jgi:hypothetical protein
MLKLHSHWSCHPEECHAGGSECEKLGVHYHKIGILLRYAVPLAVRCSEHTLVASHRVTDGCDQCRNVLQ